MTLYSRRRHHTSNGSTAAMILLTGIAFVAANCAAFVQHIITCISTEAYLLLIAGILLPFVGIIHGWGVWFGAW